MTRPENYKEAYEEERDIRIALQRKLRDCRNEMCLRCGDYKQRHLQPKTNADRIRSMTDEELAWELCRICRMPFYKDDSEIDAYEVDCWAKWLKQEASE